MPREAAAPIDRRGLRFATAVALIGLLASCGSRAALDPNLRSSATITRSRRDAPPSARPDAGAPPEVQSDPAPPEEGEWWSPYVAREALETFEGRASYYADRFQGRRTASGEPYDVAARTAASRDLAFGTILRVTRVDTGVSVIVRVNDRGPFGDRGRVLDLSRSAAEALDMIRRGVIDVRVEVLERPE